LELLIQTNLEQTAGCGENIYRMRTAELIRKKYACPDAGVQFTVGGTQVNSIQRVKVFSAFCKSPTNLYREYYNVSIS
jgi:threonine aldolase